MRDAFRSARSSLRSRSTSRPLSAPAVVLVAVDVGGNGGMERQLDALVAGALDAGWDVTVVSRTMTSAPHPRLRWRRVVSPARPFSLTYPLFVLQASWWLLVLGRRQEVVVHATGAVAIGRVDVTTVHYLHASVGAEVVRARRDTRAHRLNARVARFLSERLERSTYRRPARSGLLVAVSPPLAADVVAAFPHRAQDVVVVGNGVDLDVFRPDPRARADVRASLGLSDEPVAVFVGGDWTRKRLDLAIEALRHAPGWHLVVVGAGDRASARAEAEAHQAADRLHVVGVTSSPERYLAAADALVLPSSYETFGLVVLEAAACGVPVIATGVGIVPELADVGAALLVEADAGSIAAALERLGSDPGLARSCGDAGRGVAASASWQRTVDGHLEAFERARRAKGLAA